MPVKLFIFDMGGVLLKNFDVIPEMCRILNISEKSFRKINKNRFKLLMEGRITTHDFWQEFSENSGLSIKDEMISGLFKPEVDTEVERIIIELRKNFPVVCGTNTLKEHWDYLHERDMYQVFDRVYASHIMQTAKPEKKFFRMILEAERVLPEETVFIDDFLENVNAASSLGINSFLFSDTASLDSDIKLLLGKVEV
ncbi:MAG: HAD family phosphatase [Spirochaetales bacterium]|nr:HAD family phosphatase [Spirochaetales bacterium]